ncbi:MAG: hypothetical protein NTV25_10135 [Methanothrix sp.]|nr:hypothetical protein [Methanothrix sp.]
MRDQEERARSQLMAIEQAYGIKIKNREEVARIIADKVDDQRQVLSICTSLNSWVAVNGYQGEVAIPSKLLNSLLDGA